MIRRIRNALAAIALLLSPVALAVDVNTADVPTLAAELIGIGEKTAQAIVDEREAKGPFADAKDLQTRVKGIGPKIVEKNADRLEFK